MSYLVETPWETRNLGVQSYAVSQTFYDAPDWLVLRNEIEALRAKNIAFFIYTRIDKAYLGSVAELQRVGFYLVECAFTLIFKFKHHATFSTFLNDRTAVVPERFRSQDLVFVSLERDQTHLAADRLRTIAHDSFSNDRFHQDYQCSKEVADQRFAYWMDDLIVDPQVTFDVLLLKGEIIGFTARKENYLVLLAFAKQYLKAGLSDLLLLSSCQAVKEDGYDLAHSLISANNLPIVNVGARTGFKFKNTQYSFHLWHRP